MAGPPSPRDVLKASLALPQMFEATLPAGAPQITQSLSALADNVPNVPAPALPASIPGLPALPRAGALGRPGPDFLKSLQVSLPTSGPRLPQSKSTVGISVGAEPTVTAAVKIGV